MNRKAVALLSGGLDSTLAIRLLQEQGIEIQAVNYLIAFAGCLGAGQESAAQRAARILNVPLKVVDISEEYLAILRKPKHGYGAHINPCIDCKIFMLKKAKEEMQNIGASFLVTGEVLGERPMSQRKDALNIIEKDAGVRGILLRPLSAKLLEPTLPEKESVVDREKLLDISGRRRTPQFELAKEFGIKEYPTPAGGCLLTDKGFANRVRDLMKHDALTVDNLKLSTVGRQFRLSEKARLAVGRDEKENGLLESLAKPGDIILRMKDCQGPLSILRGEADDSTIRIATGIAAYHTRLKNEESVRVDTWREGRGGHTVVTIKPAGPEDVGHYRI